MVWLVLVSVVLQGESYFAMFDFKLHRASRISEAPRIMYPLVERLDSCGLLVRVLLLLPLPYAGHTNNISQIFYAL